MSAQHGTVSDGVAIASVLVGLAWPLLIAGILWSFRKIIREFFRDLALRIRSGAKITTPWLQVDAVNVSAHSDLTKLTGITAKWADRALDVERHRFREASRNLFLVHKLLVSDKPGQLYDILVYVTPHNDSPHLAKIASVEYYFGRFWGHQVFVSENRFNNYAVAVSAYGPCLCSAKVVFDDGSAATLFRYLDFEMGPLPVWRYERPASLDGTEIPQTGKDA